MAKILIIEDEVQTRNVFLKCLEFEGFQTCAAGNALEGIDLAFREQPDLIVCDILMPDRDGYFVLSQLRQSAQTAGIPFIFLTAKVTMADLRQGMQLGADDYLTKPCTVEQFLAAIAVRLQRQQDLLRGHTQTPKIAQNPTPQEPETFCFPTSPHLETIFHYINSHFHRALKLEDIAEAAGYSPSYLSNLVQKETGRTVKQWIIARRMVQARQLLRDTDQAIAEIAEAAGYTDAGYFTKQFRRFHGETPLHWRRQHRP